MQTAPGHHHVCRAESVVARRQCILNGLGLWAGLVAQPTRAWAEDGSAEQAAAPQSTSATAIFSGGDARFLQAVFETKRPNGVLSTSIGRVADGTRAVRVTYDPAKCSYKVLLGVFWRNVDPTDGNGQFKDRGAEFRPVIYVNNAEERLLAEQSMKILVASGIYGEGAPRSVVPFAVEIQDASVSNAFELKPEDGDMALVGPGGSDDQVYKDAMKRAGRDKFFYDKYKPIKTTACEDGVCGFVYFPCTPENRCLDVTNGRW